MGQWHDAREDLGLEILKSRTGTGTRRWGNLGGLALGWRGAFLKLWEEHSSGEGDSASTCSWVSPARRPVGGSQASPLVHCS